MGRKAGTLYRGNGCRIHPDCFTCPLPDCLWGGYTGDKSVVQRESAIILFLAGERRVNVIASQMGLPSRSIRAYLRGVAG